MAESEKIIREAKQITARRLNEYIGLHKNECGTRAQCAKHFGIGEITVDRWRFGRKLITPKMAEKLKKFFRFTEAELKTIMKANVAQNSLRGLKSVQKKSVEPGSKKVLPKTNLSLVERVEGLEKKVFGDDIALKTLSSERARGIISGEKTESAVARGIRDIRFVVTQKNFMTIDSGSWSEKEILDTKRLIEELRRRLNLLAQHPDETIRLKHLNMLGAELDELWRSYQTARCIIPFQILDIIDRERQDAFLTLKKQRSSESKKE